MLLLTLINNFWSQTPRGNSSLAPPPPMILTQGCAVHHLQHVVTPQAPGVYVTGLRVQASVERAPGWLVLPFPNADRQWDVAEVDPLPGRLFERSMLASAEPCLWARAAQVVVAADFGALIREVRWDLATNTASSLDVDFAKIRKAYPSHGFAAVRLDGSGGHELAWRWRGDRPFAATAWLDRDRAPAVQTVGMPGVLAIEWATPGLDDAMPEPQTKRDGGGIEVAIRPADRNSDVVGVVQRRGAGAQPSCIIA